MRFVGLLPAVLVAASCGGEPIAKAPEPRRKPPRQAPVASARVTSELGTVDPVAVQGTFRRLGEQLVDCQSRGLARVEVLSGALKFFLRIGADGSAKWAYLEESDIGDRDTERCLLAVAMSARWPKPDGGDAEARYTMELPLQATRPPSDWPADKVAAALGRHGDAIDQCKTGANASFRATMYVGPGGHVLAAGIATSSKDGESSCDCLANELLRMKGLPSPGSWPAKVSFGL